MEKGTTDRGFFKYLIWNGQELFCEVIVSTSVHIAE